MRGWLIENTNDRDSSLYWPNWPRSGALLKVSLALLLLMLALDNIKSNQAHAINVGEPEARSYIGEPLLIQIPLFDVIDVELLNIKFHSAQFSDVHQVKVSADLEQIRSQLFLKLTTESVVDEPYINFNLNLLDSGAELSRDFTVLMDLRANDPAHPEVGLGDQLLSPKQLSEAGGADGISGRGGSVMGPYDTAKVGDIPRTFGAVLPGQALWRVARRINGAMGVTKSQMMWGLYQANPTAFLSRSISSLKAGSYLTIPNKALVQSVSDDQAKIMLEALEVDELTRLEKDNLDIVTYPLRGENQNSEKEPSNLLVSAGISIDEAKVSAFQVAHIDDTSNDVDAPKGQQPTNVSDSMTRTVSEMNEELADAEQQIKGLENQVLHLKSYLSEEELKAFYKTSSADVQSNSSAVTDSGSGPGIQNSTDKSNFDVGRETNINFEENNSVSNTAGSEPRMSSAFKWLLLCVLGLSLLVYLTRGRIKVFLNSRYPFRTSDRAQLDTKVRQYIDDELVKSDFSKMSAIDRSTDEDSSAYLEFPEEGSIEIGDGWEIGADDGSEDVDDLSFNERFERLLEERDFEFARELLDFARYNEINDERYHCERLHLFEKMDDEDGFYEYYYEIEPKIPTFPQNLQTQISKFVVQLAHR